MNPLPFDLLGGRAPASPLTAAEIKRYARHLIMPEVAMEGQSRLKASRVLCIGAGGLGSPLTLYLAAAGVGTIGLVDILAAAEDEFWIVAGLIGMVHDKH